MSIFRLILDYTCTYCLLSLCKLTISKNNYNCANFCDFKFHFTAILTTFLATDVNRVA